MKIIFSLLFSLISVCYSSAQQSDWSNVENVFGKKGAVQDGVFKITFPRYNLTIKIGDFAVAPGLALTTWVGFINTTNNSMDMGDKTMMMGDLVLLDTEVASVLTKITSLNLEVTAIHNHILNEKPSVKYIHFSGKGDAMNLAKSILSVLQVTSTPLKAPVNTAQMTKPDWSKVEAILGTTGKHNGNLLQYAIPRLEKLTESNMELPPYMGMAIAINFQMSGDKAAITGDFVLLAEEVNPVLKTLLQNGIAVTALHNHMLYDNPRLFMMHFWAVDDPEKLAKGLKAALDKTNSKK